MSLVREDVRGVVAHYNIQGMTVSLWQIERNSNIFTQLYVRTDEHFPVEEWIRLGRAVGVNTIIQPLRA